jgi:hypothetical protein
VAWRRVKPKQLRPASHDCETTGNRAEIAVQRERPQHTIQCVKAFRFEAAQFVGWLLDRRRERAADRLRSATALRVAKSIGDLVIRLAADAKFQRVALALGDCDAVRRRL